jgi:hypothetical protein
MTMALTVRLSRRSLDHPGVWYTADRAFRFAHTTVSGQHHWRLTTIPLCQVILDEAALADTHFLTRRDAQRALAVALHQQRQRCHLLMTCSTSADE